MAKKRYRVVGESVVAGHQPGEEFTSDSDAFNEAALIEGGALEIVEPSKTPAKADKSKEE